MPAFSKYPAYKPAAVPWLLRVPEHWEVLPHRALFTEVKEEGRAEDEMLSVTIGRGVLKQAEHLATTTKKDSSRKDKSTYKRVGVGDIVYNKMRAWQGAFGMSRYQGIVSPAYVVQRPTAKALPEFYHYLLRTPLFAKEAERNSYGLASDIWNLRPEHYKNILNVCPPLDEQHLIVRYLHALDTKVNRYIRAKRKLIAALQEQKQAIIQRAVTRGLDRNVKLKPSGVEWLGEVPEHWEVRPLRHFGWCQNGISKGAEYFGSGSPFVNYGDVYKNDALPSTVEGLANSSNADQELYSVQRGDVFFTRTSETLEEIGFASTCLDTIPAAIFSGFVIRVRPYRAEHLPSFSKYYFRSRIHRNFFTAEMNLVTRASLGQDLLKRMPVLLPPAVEQEAICRYLDSETGILDKALTKEQKGIEVMLEYHTRLVADVVTGAVDVRAAAKALAVEAPEVTEEEPLSMAAEPEAEYGEREE